jgi:hypothetical protein
MDHSVADANQPDRRPNVLLCIGNTLHQPFGRCLTILPALCNVFSLKQLGSPGQHCFRQIPAKHSLSDDYHPPMLEWWPGKLLPYKWLERVLCPFR